MSVENLESNEGKEFEVKNIPEEEAQEIQSKHKTRTLIFDAPFHADPQLM